MITAVVPEMALAVPKAVGVAAVMLSVLLVMALAAVKLSVPPL